MARFREVFVLLTADSFVARVRFLTREEGGRKHNPRNPAVSQLALPHVQLSCHVVAIDEQGNPLDLGALFPDRPFLARVVVDHAVHYAPELGQLGLHFKLVEGPKCVAFGTLERGGDLEVTPESVERFIRESSR